MDSSQSLIALNFLALTVQDFEFEIYRKPQNPSEPKDDQSWYSGSLPIASRQDTTEEPERRKYWVSLVPQLGFEFFYCHSRDNHPLTLFVLRQALEDQAIAADLLYERSRSRFDRAIRFKREEHPEGWEMISLEPYYLSTANKFGFLIDFSFRTRPGQSNTRRVQQLSLSLDEDGKSNSNFYVDRLTKIQAFVNKVLKTNLLFPIKKRFGQDLGIEYNLYPVGAKPLNPRIYVFSGGREEQSQRIGLKRYGPLQPVETSVQFHFIFTEALRDYAADVYKALNGAQSATFSGIESMFKLPLLSKSNTVGHKLTSFDKSEIQQLIQEIQSTSTTPTMQIAILPDKESSSEYLDLKYHTLEANLPLQVVTADLMRNESAFKWSVAGIALQTFAKLGGKPWKVKSSHQNCLIIGIGQSHQVEKQPTGETTIEKYFAYSVLMDSSGIYKDIKILGDSKSQAQYLSQLQFRIQEIVRHYRNEFTKFVIHTPFKLKHRELNAIRELLERCSQEKELSELEFVVIKVNDHNKFFGYDRSANSLVPAESSCLQLSKKEFLIWFEGIQKVNPKIKNRYSGPTHIEFYYTNRSLSYADKMLYLQDVINLSGANWRGFSAKSIPVSIYYCKLIAWKIRDFRAYGYRSLKIDTSIPWFL